MANQDPKMKIFFDEAEKLLATSKSFKDIFDIEFATFPKNTAFIFEKKSVKYSEYKTLSFKYAEALKNALKDIPLDSFVALKANNSPKWAYTFWGLIIAGYKPFLINPILLKKDANYLLKEANAKAIVLDNDEEYDVPHVNLEKLSLEKEIEEPKWANQIAFCTSGTTGKSRIFVYTGENISYQIYAAYCMPETCSTVMWDGDLRQISIVPFAHIFGFVAIFMWYTFFGRTIVFPKSLSPEDIVSAVKENKVTNIYAVPLFFDKVAALVKKAIASQSEKKQKLVNKMIAYNNRDIVRGEAGFAASKLVRKSVQKKALGTNIRMCIAGGSVLSKDTLRIINGIGYPLHNGYGMTEIGITSVELSPNVLDRLQGSVGKPLTNVEYKVLDGELLVKSPYVHSYTIVEGELKPASIDKDGYFHTGDIVEIKDERTFIRGKNKDIIIGSNGENIYPEEIEVVFKDLPYVSNLVVLGIKEDKEEVPTLVLELEQKLDKERIDELQNKISEANESLPLAMQVKAFYLSTAPLPLNASLKIMRYQIKDDFKNRPESFIKLSGGEIVDFAGYDEKEVQEIVNHLIDIISDVLYVEKEKVAPNSHIVIDLGGDSFSYMSVIASVESEFNVEIKSELIGRLNTPNEFALYILRNRK